MVASWPRSTLADAGITLIDCDHRTPPATPTGYPYVAIPQLHDGRIDLSDVRRISREHWMDWTRKARPQAHDVLLSRRCNPGTTAFVPTGLEFAVGQNLVLLRSDGRHVYPPFLRWLVRSPDWWEQVAKHLNVGAVFDSLKCADVPRFELVVPPMSEQQGIAAVLGALDDKIDLNRRMNETLEATARALFKSWFVDFDPVHAKAKGRQPFGMDAETAALFPDTFVPSELNLGETPKGWKSAPLSDWVSPLSGGTPSKGNPAFWSGDIPWVSPKGMGEIHVDTSDDWVTRAAVGNGTRIAPSGSTLVMVRGMGLHDGVRVSQARRDVTFNQDVKALVPKDVEPALLLFALLHAQTELHARVQSSGHGTGVLPSDILLAHRITLPDPKAQRPLAAGLAAWNDRIALTRTESRTLASVRDYLLPRLLSGEIRITEAEKATVAVA